MITLRIYQQPSECFKLEGKKGKQNSKKSIMASSEKDIDRVIEQLERHYFRPSSTNKSTPDNEEDKIGIAAAISPSDSQSQNHGEGRVHSSIDDNEESHSDGRLSITESTPDDKDKITTAAASSTSDVHQNQSQDLNHGGEDRVHSGINDNEKLHSDRRLGESHERKTNTVTNHIREVPSVSNSEREHLLKRRVHEDIYTYEDIYTSSPNKEDDDHSNELQTQHQNESSDEREPGKLASMLRWMRNVTTDIFDDSLGEEDKEEEGEGEEDNSDYVEEKPVVFAPDSADFLRENDRQEARQKMKRLVAQNMIGGPNGPYGPRRQPYTKDPQTQLLLSCFNDLRAKHSITIALGDVLMQVLNGDNDKARKEAYKALDIAKKLDKEPAIGRCYLWLGIVEYNDGNDEKAYAHFRDAGPCTEEYPADGELLSLYLSLPTGGIKRKDRSELLSRNAVHKQMIGSLFTRGSGHSTKRKHNRTTPVLRTPVRRQPNPKDTSHNKKAPPILWIQRDTSDIECHESGLNNHYSRLGEEVQVHVPASKLRDVNKDPATKAVNSYSGLYQQTFDFRNYPKGLAARTRGTDIFPEQPWEVILPETDWAHIKENMEGTDTTMGFLRHEQEKMSKFSRLKAHNSMTLTSETSKAASNPTPASPSKHGEHYHESTSGSAELTESTEKKARKSVEREKHDRKTTRSPRRQEPAQ